jgi:glycosyltransferase involved in cell wall biosynthesis
MIPHKPPLFSIVIPTRNRAHLLQYALRSALNQEFDDYEIIIIANDCQDNTREVVQSMATSKVHYFETEKLLPAINNWEYGWSKTSGQYILYLCDDDALISTALNWLANQALVNNPEFIIWHETPYYIPSPECNTGNFLFMEFFSDELIEDMPCSQLRHKLAHFQISDYIFPKITNCALNRNFFELWRNRLGRLFFPVTLDNPFAWIAAHICSYARILHKPLSIRGVHKDAASYYNGGFELNPALLNDYKDLDFFAETKLNLALPMNHRVADFLRVNDLLIKWGITPEPIDFPAYIIEISKQLSAGQHLLANSESSTQLILEISKTHSFQLYEQVKNIFSQQARPDQIESLRELHKRTRKMALEYLPNIEISLKRHSDDSQSALCSLALYDDILVNANWAYLYIFGDVLNVNNIYSMSLHVERYYDLLLKGRKLQREAMKKNSHT